MNNSDADILVFNAHILTINNELETFRRGYIIIKNSKIVDIGSMDKFQSNYKNKIDVKEKIDAKGDLVFPGFVNAQQFEVYLSYFHEGADKKTTIDNYAQNFKGKLSSTQ